MIYGFISFLIQEERKNIDLSCNSLLENGGIKSEFFCEILGTLVWEEIIQLQDIGDYRRNQTEQRMQELSCQKESVKKSI